MKGFSRCSSIGWMLELVLGLWETLTDSKQELNMTTVVEEGNPRSRDITAAGLSNFP